MSNFNKALAYVLENEGGLYDDRKGSGEYSYEGISRTFLLTIKFEPSDPTKLDTETIKNLYWVYFWEWYNLGNIVNDNCATKCMDMYVNMPPRAAGEIIQRAINSCPDMTPVIVDGILGHITMTELNKCNPTIFLANIINFAEWYYKGISTIGNNSKNLTGWLARARKLPV